MVVAATLRVLREGLVFVVAIGIFCDDVPGMEEAGDETKHAEEDVDEGVCRADASLDPDCWFR